MNDFRRPSMREKTPTAMVAKARGPSSHTRLRLELTKRLPRVELRLGSRHRRKAVLTRDVQLGVRVVGVDPMASRVADARPRYAAHCRATPQRMRGAHTRPLTTRSRASQVLHLGESRSESVSSQFASHGSFDRARTATLLATHGRQQHPPLCSRDGFGPTAKAGFFGGGGGNGSVPAHMSS